MNLNDTDRTRGLYNKYAVIRTDGSSAVGERHHGCEHFVLDVNHDPFAAVALRAYADACESEYPLLARDLRLKAAATGDPIDG
jgi:hypothetical protein